MEYLFVYGSLRREYGHPLRREMDPLIQSSEMATCPGRLYHIDWYPGMVEADERTNKGNVVGELLGFHKNDLEKLWPTLDEFEDYFIHAPERSLFLRKKCFVFRQGSETSVEAFVYIYNGVVDQTKLIASGDFLNSEFINQGKT